MQNVNLIAQDKGEERKEQVIHNVQNTLRSGLHILIKRVLSVMAILGILAVISGVYDLITTGNVDRFLIITGVYLGLLIIAFAPGVTYRLQAVVLLFVLYVMGVINLLISGHAGYGLPFLLAASVLTPLFLGQRTGIVATIIVILTVIVIGVLFVTGVIYVPKEALPNLDDTGHWITGVIVILMIGAILTIPQNDILNRFMTALSQEHQLTSTLENERNNLEKLVAERTRAVARRERYLSASTFVAREAASVIEDPGELLHRVVDLVSEQFGFYHTGLFINDENGEWAELKAASSEGGQKMLTRSHRLRIGSEGIVGHVALSGQPRIALDVGGDVVFFSNVDLPDTRSEIALPLMIREEVIGVLDVQSTESQAFNEDDITVLQSLADQVALAISNSRLYTLAQKSIETERNLRGDISRERWRDLLLTEQNFTAKSIAAGFSSGDEIWTSEMVTALHEAEPVIDDETMSRVAIPVRVAGKTIGVVAARKSQSADKWSGEEMRLLNTLSDQLSAAVERARLYRQAQLIASRQQTITEVGARMRASLQLESMLQTAANEIREALDLGELEIRLAPPTVVSNQVESLSTENGEYL